MTISTKACFAALLAASPGVAEAADGLAGTPDPSNIYGGGPVEPCAWPTAVFINDCTGTLVHPSVVVLAAHCVVYGGQAHEARFGENHNQPARTVGVSSCSAHPDWVGDAPGDNASDIAVCQLSNPVEDVPIVPIAMGCETEALQVGASVTLVGFGDADDALGYGPKRSVTTDLKQVGNDAAWIGGNGQSSCYGDSGGPAYIQLDDGSWRVFGAVSGSATDDPGCGQTGIWTLVHVYAQWIENTTGVDVTPCHDADGTWNPSEACTSFPLTPGASIGEWGNGCRGGELTGVVETCGPGSDEGGSTSGGGTDESGSIPEGESGGRPGGSESGDESTSDDPPDEDDSDETSGGGALDPGLLPQTAPVDSGCACTSAPARTGNAWLLALLALACRRRRVSWGGWRPGETSTRATAPRP